MYSRWQPPRGVIRLKQPIPPPPHYMHNGHKLVAISYDGNLWCIYNFHTLIVEAIFYSLPNQHGFSSSESHAQSYINQSCPRFYASELDDIA